MHNNKTKNALICKVTQFSRRVVRKLPLLDIDMNVYVTLHTLNVYLLLQPSLLQKKFGILLHTTTI